MTTEKSTGMTMESANARPKLVRVRVGCRALFDEWPRSPRRACSCEEGEARVACAAVQGVGNVYRSVSAPIHCSRTRLDRFSIS